MLPRHELHDRVVHRLRELGYAYTIDYVGGQKTISIGHSFFITVLRNGTMLLPAGRYLAASITVTMRPWSEKAVYIVWVLPHGIEFTKPDEVIREPTVLELIAGHEEQHEAKKNPAYGPGDCIYPRFMSYDDGYSVFIDHKRLGNLGYVDVKHKSRCRAAVVSSVGASPGWGPLVYDYAALIATEVYKTILVSDRYEVSRQALKVWRYYRDERPDVVKHDISGKRGCTPQDVAIPTWGISISKEAFARYWDVDPNKWLPA